jgi:hypothetical protein
MIDVRSNSVQVFVDGGICTKVILPDNAQIDLLVQPSMLKHLGEYSIRAISMTELASCYKDLLASGGTYQDLKAFCNDCNFDQILEQFEAAYFAKYGANLPKLKNKRIKRDVIFSTADMVSAVEMFSAVL